MNSQDSNIPPMPHMQNGAGSNGIVNTSQTNMQYSVGSSISNGVADVSTTPHNPTNDVSNEMLNMFGMPQIPGAMGLHGMVNRFAHFNPTFQPRYIFNPNDANVTPLISQQNGFGMAYQQSLNTSPADHPAEKKPLRKRAKIKDNNLLNSQASENLLSCTNWSKDEDVALTSAWLYISMDADIGNNQKTGALWGRVFPVWKEKMGNGCNMTRTPSSLQQRWKKIHQAVTKFNSYYDRIDRHPQSGTNLEDMKRQAIRLYLSCTKKKEFKFEHCWAILRSNPKWCTKFISKTNESNGEAYCKDGEMSAENIVPQSTNDVEKTNSTSIKVNKSDAVARPQGRKACKESKRKINEENGMIDALKNLHSTLQNEIELKRDNNKKEFEFKQQIMAREMEFKASAEKRKLKEQELREEAQKREEERMEKEQHKNEQRQKKALKREEQHRIMSLDVTKLSGEVRKRVEAYQMRILNLWESDELFQGESENETADDLLTSQSNSREDTHPEKE